MRACGIRPFLSLAPRHFTRFRSKSFQMASFALLVGKEDNYSGVVVDHLSLPSDPGAFRESLAASLAAWKEAGKKGIWCASLHSHLPNCGL